MSKVAFVVPYRFVPPKNGGHKAAYGFAEFLAQEVDLTVYSSQNNAETTLPFRLKRLFLDTISKYIDPALASRFYTAFRKDGITHCILHQHFMGLLLWPVCMVLGIRRLVFVQNIEYQRFRTLGKWWWPLMYLSEWLIYKTSHQLLFISPADQPIGQKAFGLRADKCTVVHYGTPLAALPGDRQEARATICERHKIDPLEKILLFFGPQSYSPNLKAVERIILEINPLLQAEQLPSYRFLICGGGLPAHFERLTPYRDQGIQYLGFVEDIETYVKAADVMINPIDTGGGVKTKVIESIAVGTPVVSSITGATGVDAAACGPMLRQVPDVDYDAFCTVIQQVLSSPLPETPHSFYDLYYWKKAVQPALPFLAS
jgi:glycosyltransferase involved in cell wall biosynthesis